jgi:acyl-coenzyme A thioesterase PaaI-like protein
MEVCALVDFGSGMNGYANTAHGGVYGVMLDEVMGTAANMQCGRSARHVG